MEYRKSNFDELIANWALNQAHKWFFLIFVICVQLGENEMSEHQNTVSK